MKTLRTALTAATLLAVASAASAAPFVVDAFANSTSGGVGKDTLSLSAGQAFSVTVDPSDLWNAGPLPRWSNANGLTGNLFATGSDDSGLVAGTQIGQNFGPYSQGGLTAPYGALVGQIGAGNFFFIGTSYSGTASTSGMLKLAYFDSNNGDNSQFITANVTAVPEPGSVALLLAGLGALGFVARRRQA